MQKLIIPILILLLFSCGDNNNSKSTVSKSIVSKEIRQRKHEIPKNFFILDTMKTVAGSMIYWQHNKDSSWLSYEEVSGKKTILNNLGSELMGYTYRLGTQRFNVYPNYAVFVHEWISGCCTPPDIIFMDIHKPKEINRIRSYEYIMLDDEQDICVYFTDSSLNKVAVIDLKRDKTIFIKFPKGLLKSKIESSGYSYPRDFFTDIKRKNNELNYTYKYKNDETDTIWIEESLFVNIK